jgi:hypothetical protein
MLPNYLFFFQILDKAISSQQSHVHRDKNTGAVSIARPIYQHVPKIIASRPEDLLIQTRKASENHDE